jgi:hypothetical protein
VDSVKLRDQTLRRRHRPQEVALKSIPGYSLTEDCIQSSQHLSKLEPLGDLAVTAGLPSIANNGDVHRPALPPSNSVTTLSASLERPVNIRCRWLFVGELQRHPGKDHHAAGRALAFKRIRIAFRCWKNAVPYDDSRYIERLRRHGSPLIAFLAKPARP